MPYTVRVWDAPTRLFHWALVLGVITLVVTAQLGGDAMTWHFRAGYAVLSLLLFRLIWGFVGGYWSRFATFLYHPSHALRYLRGQGDPSHSVGHNPLGALSVYAMLGVLLLQVGSGLFSDDEIAAAGPLTRFVSSQWVSNATWYHKDIGKPLLLALVALHLAAIGFYSLIKGEKLAPAMVHGDKVLDRPEPSSRDHAADRLKALLILSVCFGVVAGVLLALA